MIEKKQKPMGKGFGLTAEEVIDILDGKQTSILRHINRKAQWELNRRSSSAAPGEHLSFQFFGKSPVITKLGSETLNIQDFRPTISKGDFIYILEPWTCLYDIDDKNDVVVNSGKIYYKADKSLPIEKKYVLYGKSLKDPWLEKNLPIELTRIMLFVENVGIECFDTNWYWAITFSDSIFWKTANGYMPGDVAMEPDSDVKEFFPFVDKDDYKKLMKIGKYSIFRQQKR